MKYAYPEWTKIISSEDDDIEDFEIGPEIERPMDDETHDIDGNSSPNHKYIWIRVNYQWVPVMEMEEKDEISRN